jgi:hypothetical protein
MDVDESTSQFWDKRDPNLVMSFQCHLVPLLLSFPPTSNHPGKEDKLTFQVSLTLHSVGFYYHCTILSGLLAFLVGFETIPAISHSLPFGRFWTPKDIPSDLYSSSSKINGPGLLFDILSFVLREKRG